MSASPTHPWPRWIDDLRRFVGRRVSDPHAVDDIVQDTLAKLAVHLREAPAEVPLHAWVLRVARNAVVDYYRAHRADTDGVEELAVDDPATQRLERQGLLASFRAFVHALPPAQREAVLLTQIEGISQTELAERLGVPLSTVKSRVQRGRKRLATALSACCNFEFDRRGHLVDWQRRADTDCPDCRDC